jgi:K+-sensing histidine kinase KdpD
MSAVLSFPEDLFRLITDERVSETVPDRVFNLARMS